MTTVLDFMKRLERLTASKVYDIAAEAMEDTRDNYIREQRAQMYEGKNSLGRDIKPAYKSRTISIKIRKGQPWNRVTLKDRGDFYRAIFLDVRERTFVVDSHDWKSEKLQAKYSKWIFLLNKQHRGLYIDYAYFDAFMHHIKKQLGLK